MRQTHRTDGAMSGAPPTEHVILVNHDQSAVILAEDPARWSVTAYVRDLPTVAVDCASYGEAERWAKAVIAYPEPQMATERIAMHTPGRNG